MPTTALAPPPVTAASILALVDAIGAHPAGAPAVTAFRLALARKGREADDAGGVRALDALMAEVAAVDPGKADTRCAILRAAWGELLPGPGGRARP